MVNTFIQHFETTMTPPAQTPYEETEGWYTGVFHVVIICDGNRKQRLEEKKSKEELHLDRQTCVVRVSCLSEIDAFTDDRKLFSST